MVGVVKTKTNDKDKIMSQIISEELNCKEKNLKNYGYSSENIIFKKQSEISIK